MASAPVEYTMQLYIKNEIGRADNNASHLNRGRSAHTIAASDAATMACVQSKSSTLTDRPIVAGASNPSQGDVPPAKGPPILQARAAIEVSRIIRIGI